VPAIPKDKGGRTPEQRREAALKAAETRGRNAERKAVG